MIASQPSRECVQIELRKRSQPHSPGKTILRGLAPAVTARHFSTRHQPSLAACGTGVPRSAHPRQQFGGGPGIGGQAVFDLHRLHRAAALLAHHAVDLADIEASAHQQLLQLAEFVERQLHDRRQGPLHRRRACDAGGEIAGGGRIDQRVIPFGIGARNSA